MSYQSHPQARTTPKVRGEIKASSLSPAQLATKYNITIPTAQKWQERDSIEDRSHRPHKLNTTLSEVQELIVVELRRTFLLPLDDLLVVTRAFINADVSRSGLGRCLVRHQVNDLKALIAAQNPEAESGKRISELVQQTRFASAAELEKTLTAYLKVYNHHIPQKALNHQPPIQALKIWQQNKPDIFVKKVYDQVGLDT